MLAIGAVNVFPADRFNAVFTFTAFAVTSSLSFTFSVVEFREFAVSVVIFAVGAVSVIGAY